MMCPHSSSHIYVHTPIDALLGLCVCCRAVCNALGGGAFKVKVATESIGKHTHTLIHKQTSKQTNQQTIKRTHTHMQDRNIPADRIFVLTYAHTKVGDELDALRTENVAADDAGATGATTATTGTPDIKTNGGHDSNEDPLAPARKAVSSSPCASFWKKKKNRQQLSRQ